MPLNKKNCIHSKDSHKIPSRKSVIFKRWFDLILLSLVAPLIYFVVSLFLKFYFLKASSTIGISPTWIQYLIYILIFTLLWLPAVRYGSFSSGSILSSSFFKYPPFWLACIFSILVIYILQPYVSIISDAGITSVPLVIIFDAFEVVVAGAIIAVGYSKLIHWHSSSCDKSQEKHATKKRKPITEDSSALFQWLKEERPIETIDQDRLNNKPFAERIIDVLRQPKVTITVVGSYGAGKSSILNMVQDYLRAGGANGTLNRLLIPCNVCGWGLQKDSAGETILKQVIQTCAQHVDCFGLSNLPAQYGASIGHVSAWSKVLSGLLSHSYDPMVALERMDRVLLAIDKRVVIFFEDLDRNWQGNDFWVEIISLLDRLKKLDRVSFVLAITETKKIGDVTNRISDHVEIVPRLSFDYVSKIYLIFKRLCFQENKDDILFTKGESQYHRIVSPDILLQDQISDSLNTKSDVEDAVLQDQINYLLNMHLKDELDPVTALLENPRNLKHALRRTYSAWKSLHGEIEFDHLFIANVFRVAVPIVFNFIHDHISDIHWLQEAREEKDAKQVREKLQQELSKITEDSLPLSENIEKLVHFLFPYFRHSPLYRHPMIQGFSDTRATDYWNRMIREKLNEGEIRDQEVAKAITEWKQNKDSLVYKGFSLVQAVSEIPGIPEKIEQLKELLDGQDVRVLISQLFEYVFYIKGVRSFNVPGMKELIRLTHEKIFSDHGQWLIDEVSRLFSINLSIATKVLSNFLAISEQTKVQRICNALLENAKSTYSDKNIFIKAIDSPPDSVMCFISVLRKIYTNYGGEKVNSDKWKWLADLLLDAVKTHASIVIPQILRFAVFKEVEPSEKPWILNSKFIETFFQERQREVMLLLSNIDTSQLVEKLRSRAAAAQELANKWLWDPQPET